MKTRTKREQEEPDKLYVNPLNFWELIYKRITDRRITEIGTVNVIGQWSKQTILTVVDWGDNQRTYFLFGRKLKTKRVKNA